MYGMQTSLFLTIDPNASFRKKDMRELLRSHEHGVQLCHYVCNLGLEIGEGVDLVGLPRGARKQDLWESTKVRTFSIHCSPWGGSRSHIRPQSPSVHERAHLVTHSTRLRVALQGAEVPGF